MKIDYCEKTGNPKISGSPEEAETLLDVKYKDIKDVIKQIHRQHGTIGFFRGSFPRMMFVAPGVAISWGTYEVFKALLASGSN